MSRREHGKTQFGHIQDETGKLQLYLRKDTLSQQTFANLSLLDLGDFAGARGERFRTKAGEFKATRKIVKSEEWQTKMGTRPGVPGSPLSYLPGEPFLTRQTNLLRFG